ncbi:MAG: hypothetical protein ABF535_03550 [Acetobacter sp.]
MLLDNAFRPAAFWFWHYLPGEDECRESLRDARAAGLGCVMVQTRLSFPRAEYLSPAYLERCRFVSAEARALGLDLEIYDEYNWMSGHGGGRTVQGADHLRERHLFWCRAPLRQGRASFSITGIRSDFLGFLGQEGADWCYETGVPRWSDWTVVGLVRDDGQPFQAEAVDLVADESGCRVELGAPGLPEGGEVTLLVAARCATSRLVNYLLPEAARRFAERVYAPLLEAMPDAESFFFDHPYAGFYTWNEQCGSVGNSILWDDSLLADGVTLQQLASLAAGDSPENCRARVLFFRRYATLMHRAFFGTLRSWCDMRGKGLTGHEILPHVGAWALRGGLKGFDPRVMPGTDYFGFDRFRTATTVDAADFHSQLSVLMGDSIARANGRSRCTVEQYATGREAGRPSLKGQWDLSLHRLRMQCIGHVLNGARRVLLHALYLPGVTAFEPAGDFEPLFDFPPGFNMQPWWRYMPLLSDYLARLSVFLEDGHPVRTVGLVYPLADLWASDTAPASAEQFGHWAQALDAAGCAFAVVDESQFTTTITFAEEIDTLILPGLGWLEQANSLDQLGRFAARPGCRLLSGGPVAISTVHGAGERPCASGLPVQAVAVGDIPQTAENLASGQTGARAMFVKTRDNATRITWHRIKPGHDRFAVFNTATHWGTLDIPPAPHARHVRLWCLESGTWLAECHVPAQTGVTLALRPHDVMCLDVMSPISPAGSGQSPVPPLPLLARPPAVTDAGRQVVPLPDGWGFVVPGQPSRPVSTACALEEQGIILPEGMGQYTLTFTPPPLPEGCVWYLVVPEVSGVLDCRMNGQACGVSPGAYGAFAVPEDTGPVTLVFDLRTNASRRFYPEDYLAGERSGLTAVPYLEAWPLRPVVMLQPDRAGAV